MLNRIAAASAPLLLMAGSAFAGTAGVSTADLNLRTVPGTIGQVIDVIPASAEVSIERCATELNWCKVTYDGKQGWAYSPYLSALHGAQTIEPYDTPLS